MDTLYRYLLIGIACGALLLGIQVPNFVDQYEKRVDAHLLEVKNNLRGYQDIADRLYGGSIAALIDKHQQSGEEPFKQEARPIKNMLDRYEHFAREQSSLAAGPIKRVAHIITRGDRELLGETYRNYSFTVPLNQGAVVWGFIFMGVVVGMIETLRMALLRIWRAKRRSGAHA